MARTRRTLRSHWRPRRVPLAWWGRSEKATAVIIGIPGSSLVLGGNHHIPPSRSEPHCLSGNDFFCHLETAHMWTEPPIPLQRGLRPAGTVQAEQGTPRAQTPREESLSRSPGAPQLPRATHIPTSGPKRPFRETPEHLWGTGSRAEGGLLVRGAQESPLLRLCDLFNTGEDFDDNL